MAHDALPIISSPVRRNCPALDRNQNRSPKESRFPTGWRSDQSICKRISIVAASRNSSEYRTVGEMYRQTAQKDDHTG
jgi:hypothetical protein